MALWARWYDIAERPAEVAVALWYHDAIYDTRAPDSERRSADWAAQDLRSAGVADGPIYRVKQLVMATCHHAPAATTDAQLVVDIDLAILGSSPQRFEASSGDVREEYGWVPEGEFRRRRAEVLSRFLARRPLYGTAVACMAFEAQARENLAEAIAGLESD